MKIKFVECFRRVKYELSTICDVKIGDLAAGKKAVTIELFPRNEYGQEKLYISVYDDRITLSYDYYESFLTKGEKSTEIFFESIITTVKQILKEELIVATTYHKLHTTTVSNIMSPLESKRISRKNNYRSRSFLGTYDEDTYANKKSV